MPISSIPQDRGWMGDRSRGASMGRGATSAASTMHYLRNEIASLESAAEMFGDMLAGRRALNDWTREQVQGYADNAATKLQECRASLARAETSPQDDQRFYLQRVHLDSGGYDSGGSYWGHGAPLWRYESADGMESGYLRSKDREAAKADVLESNPAARFFR